MNRLLRCLVHVGTGGVGGFFPDNEGGKPWMDSDPDASMRFWEAKEQWYSTWKRGDSALQVGVTRGLTLRGIVHVQPLFRPKVRVRGGLG